MLCNKGVYFVLLGLVYVYQWVLSPFFRGGCRFMPSCSVYAAEALRIHGPWRGLWLSFLRISRCHPFSKRHGLDPVPPKNLSQHNKTPPNTPQKE